MGKICLLDLNYTLVSNQATTKTLRPFSRRLAAEEYRTDLIEAVRGDHVIRVHEYDPLPGAFLQPAVPGGGYPLVFLGEQPDAAVPPCVFPADCQAAVR